MGDNYVKTRQYHTSSKGAQEAHEAIRPTYVENQQIEGTQQEKRLYDLIWKRTVASQMADAEVEKTQVNISVEGTDEYFVAQGEVIKFDGFLRVYKETEGENESATEAESTLPALTVGEALNRSTLTATQRFAQHPVRYNEASLVRKLEELGIGRPSTYAATITTIQQREYVAKGDKAGEERTQEVITLAGDELAHSQNKTTVGAERGKLMPVLPIVRVADFDSALALALRVEEGLHHTAIMHSQNVSRLNLAARTLQTSIFVKNGPSYAGIGVGGEGFTTFTIATPTGEGTTSARTFARLRRCVLTNGFSIR